MTQPDVRPIAQILTDLQDFLDNGIDGRITETVNLQRSEVVSIIQALLPDTAAAPAPTEFLPYNPSTSIYSIRGNTRLIAGTAAAENALDDEPLLHGQFLTVHVETVDPDGDFHRGVAQRFVGNPGKLDALFRACANMQHSGQYEETQVKVINAYAEFLGNS